MNFYEKYHNKWQSEKWKVQEWNNFKAIKCNDINRNVCDAKPEKWRKQINERTNEYEVTVVSFQLKYHFVVDVQLF